jgi:hypothetical protein
MLFSGSIWMSLCYSTGCHFATPLDVTFLLQWMSLCYSTRCHLATPLDVTGCHFATPLDVTGCHWMSLDVTFRLQWMSLDVTGCHFQTPMDVTGCHWMSLDVTFRLQWMSLDVTPNSDRSAGTLRRTQSAHTATGTPGKRLLSRRRSKTERIGTRTVTTRRERRKTHDEATLSQTGGNIRSGTHTRTRATRSSLSLTIEWRTIRAGEGDYVGGTYSRLLI